MRRTAPERLAEANRLEAIRLKVRRHTAFGEDNLAAIDAQIDTLRGLPYDPAEDDDEEDTTHVEMAISDVEQWIAGESDESPSESWMPLVKESS